MVSHTAINAAFITQHAGPFHVKFSALQNWFGVICSVLWPEEVTESNQALIIIILKGIHNFGAVSNTFFECLPFHLSRVKIMCCFWVRIREIFRKQTAAQSQTKGLIWLLKNWDKITEQPFPKKFPRIHPESAQGKQADGETSTPSPHPWPATIYNLVQGSTHSFARSSPNSDGRSHISKSNANVQHTAFPRVLWTTNAALTAAWEPLFKSIKIRAQVWKRQ